MSEETAVRIEGIGKVDDSKICYWKDKEDGIWWLYLPGCGAGMLIKHAVVEHEDGTITVTPSILMAGHYQGTKTQRHGYLTKGVWREV